MNKILGMALTNDNDSLVAVSGSLYVKTPEALQVLFHELRAIGYEIDNLRQADYRKKNHVSVETMEKDGWSLWFAKLDTRRGKCGSCNQFISLSGIRSHGHTCELCGAVTYYDVIDGSLMRFSFIERDKGGSGMADIKMKVKRWDTQEGFIYFYPEVLDGLWLRGERALSYFNAYKDLWEEVTENEQKLIRMKYPQPWDYNTSVINPSDISGHFFNHSVVKVWEGKEYDEYSSDFPYPDSISIYESWNSKRHPVSPTLHTTILRATGQNDDKGWHYQDGRPWFTEKHWKNMSLFIRHFTELDADAFDKAWPSFRSAGPEGIDDLARFCHRDAQVRDEPNIGNLLIGVSEILSGGGYLTQGEISAVERAVADETVMSTVKKIFG